LSSWRVVAVLALLALSAFFSGSETALFSLRQHHLQRLRTSTARAAALLLGLLEQPRRVLATVLVGNTTVNVLLSVLATGSFVERYGPERGPVVATLVLTVTVLVLGEIAPKSLAVARPLGIALRIAWPLVVFQRLLAPATAGLVRLADGASGVLARRTRIRDEALTEDEIKTLVTMGWERGVVGAREKEFIHNVFHLDDRRVSEIATPRARVFALDLEAVAAEATDAVQRAGFARVPLYSGSADNLVGYVEVMDLLWSEPGPDLRRLRELRRDLPFYPETKRVGELLSDLRRTGQEIAAVVDEHGDFAGIVTLEDAVEQVVGEIFDLHDLDRFRFTTLPDGDLVVTAQMEVSVFNRLLDTTLVDADAETIGGLVINRLGRIPTPGERLEVQGLRFTVDQAAPNRVVTLRVRRLSEPGGRS
jgi:putative hemolysin